MSENKAKRQLSPEVREKLRENAKAMVASGKIGGARPGSGRPRKKRASEIVAERAVEEADNIVSAFSDALKDHNPASVRIKAAESWLKIEHDETKLKMEEERHVDEMKTNEIIELVVNKLGKLVNAGVLPDIIDGQAVDVIEKGTKAISQRPFNS